MSYINLHGHSAYSILDGHALVPDYVRRVKAQGHSHVALTDHGTMAALPHLWKACKEEGVTPIAGLEAYVTGTPLADQAEKKIRESYHLTLLAQNAVGYQNLIELSSLSYMHGFYYRPRIDHAALARYSEGLILLTGCGSSETSNAVLTGNHARLDYLMRFYQEFFEGRLYVEVQEHFDDFPQQRTINREMIAQAKRWGLPIVATNDSHFCAQEDLAGYKNLLNVKREGVELGSPHTWVRDNATMQKLFDAEWLATSLQIAETIEPYSLGTEIPKIPMSPWEDGNYDPHGILTMRVREGLLRVLEAPTWEHVPFVYEARMEHELDVIDEMGRQLGVPFARYFLNVGALAEYMRNANIRFSTRGSAAGSLVCWALGISALDPLANGLFFERFLNIHRISLPDIDLDVPDDRRDEILIWLQSQYGADHIARIGTYARIGPKQAIKDGARLVRDQLSVDYLELSNKLTDLIPHSANPGEQTLTKVLADPECTLAQRDDEDTRLILKTAQTISERLRGAGTHPAGIIIADRPVHQVTPLMNVGTSLKSVIRVQTQQDMDALEAQGLIKFDLLGLSELSKMEATVQLIAKLTGVNVDLEHLDWGDERVWDTICSGNSMGLFQLGGKGMTKALTSVLPRSIEDLSLVLALYRPGPMDNLDKVAARKAGMQRILSIHPSLDEVLANTYGIPVYQEQIMRILQIVAGFSLAESDVIRKAMGKKKPEEMAKHEEDFKQRGIEAGYSPDDVRKIWAYIVPFAEYGFNKSHSMAYAYEAFKSAYLKTYYPQMFYAAALTIEQRSGNAKNETTQQKLGRFIQEAKRFGIPVYPPSLENPVLDFTPEGEGIRYGLSAILQLGVEAARQIVKVRPQNLVELAEGCPKATKRDMEALIAAGVFPGSREGLREHMEQLLKIRAKRKPHVRKNETREQAEERGILKMTELFAEARAVSIRDTPNPPIAVAEEELKHLGMIHSPFPTLGLTGVKLAELPHYVGHQIPFVALLAGRMPMVSRAKREYCKLMLMDETGMIEALIWPEAWQELKHTTRVNTLVSGIGRVRLDPEWEELPDPPLSAISITIDELQQIGDEITTPPEVFPELVVEVAHDAPPERVLPGLIDVFAQAQAAPGEHEITLRYGNLSQTFAVDRQTRIAFEQREWHW